jgi:O-methyltransferase
MHDSFEDHRLKASNPRNQFQGYPILSDQITREGLSVVWRELESILKAGTPGDVAEFGCYAGTTSVFVRRLLNKHKSQKAFHVYDSFDGLPEKTAHDSNAAGIDFSAGKLYVSKADFVKVFKAASLQLPIVHKGWFSDLVPKDVPKQLAFAFLDGDFYRSILDSLKLTWPVLDENGVLLIDDFGRETLPGVERAVRDYFGGTLPKMRVEHNIAIIYKGRQ